MARTMMAAVFEKPGKLAVREWPVPVIKKSDDVLVRMESGAICGSDTRALMDPPEFIYKENIVLGHKSAGKVAEVGRDVTDLKPGDRVVVHPNLWCGKCHSCRTGHINLCTNVVHLGNMIDGTLAEYAVVPERLLYKVSSDLPAEVAALAEPLACVLNATRIARPHPGETALVLGAGPIGLIFAAIYKASGARKVFASEVSPLRAKKAKEMGVDVVIDPSKENLSEVIMKETGGIGVDVVADAVGLLLPDGIRAAKKGATIVCFGLNEARPIEFMQAQLTFKELKVSGAYIANGTFPLAVTMLENHTLPLEKLITHHFPLRDTQKGFDAMYSGVGMKVIIEC